jgi:hypothetical protein
MAYTIVNTYDFRGADSASTKRAPRIGTGTLTEIGSPSYSADGVTCSSTGAGLIYTLPGGLQLARPFWIMCSMRRLGTPDGSANVFGFIHNNSDSGPFASAQCYWNGLSDLILGINEGGTFAGTVSSLNAAINTDYALTVRYGNSSAELLNGSSSIASDAVAADPTYDASAMLAIGNYTGINRNSNMRAGWLIVGTGAISDAEITTIQASPSTYLYPATTTPFRPYYITG